MRFFLEAATIAGFGAIWIIWRVVVARKGRTLIMYHYEDDER